MSLNSRSRAVVASSRSRWRWAARSSRSVFICSISRLMTVLSGFGASAGFEISTKPRAASMTFCGSFWSACDLIRSTMSLPEKALGLSLGCIVRARSFAKVHGLREHGSRVGRCCAVLVLLSVCCHESSFGVRLITLSWSSRWMIHLISAGVGHQFAPVVEHGHVRVVFVDFEDAFTDLPVLRALQRAFDHAEVVVSGATDIAQPFVIRYVAGLLGDETFDFSRIRWGFWFEFQLAGGQA